MDVATPTLGQRIVEAARLAVAMHLAGRAEPSAADALIRRDDARQQVVIGGADQALVMEDPSLPIPRADRPQRSFRSADDGGAGR